MKNTLIGVIWVFFLMSSFSVAVENSCLKCHDGLASIRAHDSGMMQAILSKAEEAGVKGNDCVVCHGGSPDKEVKEAAHPNTFWTTKGLKRFTHTLQAHE